MGPNLLQGGYLKVLHNLLQEGQVHQGPGPSIQKVLGGTAAGVFKLLGLSFAKRRQLGWFSLNFPPVGSTQIIIATINYYK